MVEGKFVKKYIWSILCLCFGLFLTVMLSFCVINDQDSIYDVAPGLFFGVIYTLGSIATLFINHKAYLVVENGYIKGRFHLFGRIDCAVSEVEFAFAQPNVLTLELKSGKIYKIFGVSNSYVLCSEIRRCINYNFTESPKSLLQKLEKQKKNKTVNLILIVALCVIMFINIFVTVLLTGERELYQFSRTDWMIFSVFCAAEVITVILLFYLALRAGKKLYFVEKSEYEVRRRVVETARLPLGIAKNVYSNDAYTIRVTLLGFPNSPSLYYTVEMLDFNYKLKQVDKSEVYEDVSSIPAELSELIDISDKFEI